MWNPPEDILRNIHVNFAVFLFKCQVHTCCLGVNRQFFASHCFENFQVPSVAKEVTFQFSSFSSLGYLKTFGFLRVH